MTAKTSFFNIRRSASNVYMLNFRDGTVVVFKALKWKDFQALLSLELFPTFDQFANDLQDELFLECVLDCNIPGWRDNIDKLPAGLVETVARAIYKVSGVPTTNDMIAAIEQSRWSYGLIFSQVQSILSLAFKITPQEIEELEWPDILNLLVIAENIIGGAIPEVPFKVADTSNIGVDPFEENKEDLQDHVIDMKQFEQAAMFAMPDIPEDFSSGGIDFDAENAGDKQAGLF